MLGDCKRLECVRKEAGKNKRKESRECRRYTGGGIEVQEIEVQEIGRKEAGKRRGRRRVSGKDEKKGRIEERENGKRKKERTGRRE